VNPVEQDDDGDGYSENQGDCDDANAQAIHFCGELIHADTFEMGCTPGQIICNEDEVPVHTVTLTNDFILSKTEVTQAQFLQHMGWNPSVFSACGLDCPVDLVYWDAAAEYANRVSEAEGLPPCFDCVDEVCTPVGDPYACEGYRLPTEAEWEFAARCNQDYLFAGSNRAEDVAWTTYNSRFSTHPVASLAPNDCGLYDMSGNVWEWVWDVYSEEYYAESPSIDPHGPSTGTDHVYRGGSATNESGDARVTDRCSGCHPIHLVNSVGFRLARTAP